MKNKTRSSRLGVRTSTSRGQRLVGLTLILIQLYTNVSLAEVSGANATNAPPIAVYLPLVDPQHADIATQLQTLWQNFLDGHRSNDPAQPVVALRWINDWHNYQQGVRLGRAGVYLAPPHFAAWLIHRHRFVPRMRLSSPLSFVIAARRNDAQIFEVNDLARRSVCAPQPLNLDYLLVNRAFDQPMLSAEIRIIPSVFTLMRNGGGVEVANNRVQCRGFALNHRQFAMLEHQLPDHYIRLHQSPEFTNYAIVVNAAINANPAQFADLFEAFLRSEDTQTVLAPVLTQLAENPLWIDASKVDYPSSYFEPLQRFWD